MHKHREILIPRFESLRQDFTEAYLEKTGLSCLEQQARFDMIPEKIKQSIPPLKEGFGLSGGYGIGKSFAIAALLRKEAEELIDHVMEAMVTRLDQDFLIEDAANNKKLRLTPIHVWVNWPSVISEQRSKLYQKETQSMPESWIQELSHNSNITIVLDDIGSEHVTSQDWAGEALNRIIIERHRWGGRTIWTSNLDSVGLAERYGGRLHSRLLDLAPIIHLPKLTDLRGRRKHFPSGQSA